MKPSANTSLRIPWEDFRLIKRAAKLRGQAVATFARIAALEEAMRVVELERERLVVIKEQAP